MGLQEDGGMSEQFDWKHLGDMQVRLHYYEVSRNIELEELYQAFARRLREEIKADDPEIQKKRDE